MENRGVQKCLAPWLQRSMGNILERVRYVNDSPKREYPQVFPDSDTVITRAPEARIQEKQMQSSNMPVR